MNIHSTSLIAAVTGGALGQLLMKQGMTSLDCFRNHCTIGLMMQEYSAVLFIIAGIGLYIGSVLLWVVALKKYDLGYAYPILALGYVIVYLGAVLPPLSEPLTTQKTLGVSLIVIGVALSSRESLSAANYREGDA